MSVPTPKRIDDLIKLLNRLTVLHEELLSVIRRKIDAMRCSDIDRMREHGKKEQLLVGKITEREGLRRQLMDLISEKLQLSACSARCLPLKQLATRIPAVSRSALNESGDRLRECMTRVAVANRIAGMIARQIVQHLEWVFASVRPQEGEPVGYSRTGLLVANTDTCLVDALG